jgi:hypothetical protein
MLAAGSSFCKSSLMENSGRPHIIKYRYRYKTVVSGAANCNAHAWRYTVFFYAWDLPFVQLQNYIKLESISKHRAETVLPMIALVPDLLRDRIRYLYEELLMNTQGAGYLWIPWLPVFTFCFCSSTNFYISLRSCYNSSINSNAEPVPYTVRAGSFKKC